MHRRLGAGDRGRGLVGLQRLVQSPGAGSYVACGHPLPEWFAGKTSNSIDAKAAR